MIIAFLRVPATVASGVHSDGHLRKPWLCLSEDSLSSSDLDLDSDQAQSQGGGAEADPVLCNHCGRTASNGLSCQGICVADSGY